MSHEPDICLSKPKLSAALRSWSVGLYVVSFFLPAVGWEGFGFMAFFWSMVIPSFLPMWLANPVLWIGYVKAANQRWHAVTIAGVVALGLAMSESWVFWRQVNVGYFLWIGSMALLAAAGLAGSAHPRKMLVDWSEHGNDSLVEHDDEWAATAACTSYRSAERSSQHIMS
jgi:hypothetical protein